MKDLVCTNDVRSLKLCLDSDPLSVSLQPYHGQLDIKLELELTNPFDAVCLHLQNKKSGFLEPSYISSYSEATFHSSMIFMKCKDEFLLFFCLSHKDQMVSLSGRGDELILHAISGTSDESKKIRPALLVCRGKHLHQMVECLMSLSLKITQGIGKLLKEKTAFTSWQETLGWQSHGDFVYHDKILDAIKNLMECNLRIGFILIDKGWQEIENGMLKSFKADKKRFPFGLKRLIQDLHALGIEHVGVSHEIMAAPDGVHPGLVEKYALERNTEGRYFPGMHLGGTFDFFNDYYTSLREEGVSFIRISDQSAPHEFVDQKQDVTKVYGNLQIAIQASSSIQFNSSHLNTDCMQNENLYNFATSSIARVANLDLEDDIEMLKTIRNGLLNAFWMQHLMLPDFDSFETGHKNSEILAILHALSGSINMISDRPGRHNKQLIRKMVLPCGKILRADKPLTLCQESVFVDPLKTRSIYKAFTHKQGVAVIAAFNLLEEKHLLHGLISASDVEGLAEENFAVFSHHKGFIGCFKLHEKIEITLKWAGADVFTFVPIKNGVAVLGCYHFFLTQGPITEITLEEDFLHISTLIATPIIIYSEREILEVRRDGHTIPWEYDEKRKILSVDSRFQSFNEHSVYSVSFE